MGNQVKWNEECPKLNDQRSISSNFALLKSYIFSYLFYFILFYCCVFVIMEYKVEDRGGEPKYKTD